MLRREKEEKKRICYEGKARKKSSRDFFLICANFFSSLAFGICTIARRRYRWRKKSSLACSSFACSLSLLCRFAAAVWRDYVCFFRTKSEKLNWWTGDEKLRPRQFAEIHCSWIYLSQTPRELNELVKVSDAATSKALQSITRAFSQVLSRFDDFSFSIYSFICPREGEKKTNRKKRGKKSEIAKHISVSGWSLSLAKCFYVMLFFPVVHIIIIYAYISSYVFLVISSIFPSFFSLFLLSRLLLLRYTTNRKKSADWMARALRVMELRRTKFSLMKASELGECFHSTILYSL